MSSTDWPDPCAPCRARVQQLRAVLQDIDQQASPLARDDAYRPAGGYLVGAHLMEEVKAVLDLRSPLAPQLADLPMVPDEEE